MAVLLDFFNCKEESSGRRLKILLYCVLLGLIVILLCVGKPYLSLSLEAIAVSPDEQYIACFEPGAEYRILCFRSDGSMVFTYNIPIDISAGGHCTLWFEGDILCVEFYRTDKVVYLTLNGSILNIAADTTEEDRPEFPSFSQMHNQYVFNGNEIDVVYREGNFLGYWLGGTRRYLAITPESGETKIVYAWTAKEGVIEEIE